MLRLGEKPLLFYLNKQTKSSEWNKVLPFLRLRVGVVINLNTNIFQGVIHVEEYSNATGWWVIEGRCYGDDMRCEQKEFPWRGGVCVCVCVCVCCGGVCVLCVCLCVCVRDRGRERQAMRPRDGSFRNGEEQVQGLGDGWGWEQCDQGTARRAKWAAVDEA